MYNIYIYSIYIYTHVYARYTELRILVKTMRAHSYSSVRPMFGRVAVHRRGQVHVHVQTTEAFFPSSRSFSFCRSNETARSTIAVLFRKFHETATKRFAALEISYEVDRASYGTSFEISKENHVAKAIAGIRFGVKTARCRANSRTVSRNEREAKRSDTWRHRGIFSRERHRITGTGTVLSVNYRRLTRPRGSSMDESRQ